MTVPNSKQSFKHLSLLRKALSPGHTGDLIYETTNSNGELNIRVTVGDLLNDEATLKALNALLIEPVTSCNLITDELDKTLTEITPPEVLTTAINNIKWNPDALNSLKQTFLKLPPIDVRMVALHRHGYADGLTYLMLYQQSLKDEGFTTKDFFDDKPSSTTLEQQIKVLVLGYCLGLINPKTKKRSAASNSSVTTAAQTRSSVAKRILDKIRGM